MRPFTRLDWILARLLPVTAGMTGAGVLNSAALDLPAWWMAVHGVGLVLCVAGLLARRHGRRRWADVHRVAQQRGWRQGRTEWDFFTESEVREIGLIHGRWLARVIRELDAETRGVEPR